MNTHRQTLQIAEDAADWLLKLQTDSGDECRQEFIAWLKHSPQHVEEFLLMSAAMQGVRASGKRQQLDVEALIAGAGFNVVDLKVSGKNGKRAATYTLAWMGHWTGHGVLSGVGVGVLTTRVAPDIYTTPTGEQRSIKLADGSFVYLNTQSRVEVRFTEQARDIHPTQGEALFVVAHEAARPFRVLAGNAVGHRQSARSSMFTHVTEGLRVSRSSRAK